MQVSVDVLDPSLKGRKLLQAGLAAVEKAFEELGEAELLLGGMEIVRWKVSTTMPVYVTR